MLKEEAIRKVTKYICSLPKPEKNIDKKVLEYRCNALWASNEILGRMMISDKDPQYVVYEFIGQMDEYSLFNEKTSFIFSTAKDVAEDIFDYLFLPFYM